MNKFVLAIMFAVFSFAAANNVMAQKDGNKGGNKGGDKEQRAKITPEERATKATERMTKRYGLDEKQAAQIKAANLSFSADMAALKGKEGQAERLPLRDKHQATIKGILTAEQNAKFEADLAEAKAKKEAQRANKNTNAGKPNGGKGNGKGKGSDNGKGNGKDAAKDKEEGTDVYDILGGDDK